MTAGGGLVPERAAADWLVEQRGVKLTALEIRVLLAVARGARCAPEREADRWQVGRVWYSEDAIATIVGATPRGVRKAINRLEQLGALVDCGSCPVDRSDRARRLRALGPTVIRAVGTQARVLKSRHGGNGRSPGVGGSSVPPVTAPEGTAVQHGGNGREVAEGTGVPPNVRSRTCKEKGPTTSSPRSEASPPRPEDPLPFAEVGDHPREGSALILCVEAEAIAGPAVAAAVRKGGWPARLARVWEARGFLSPKRFGVLKPAVDRLGVETVEAALRRYLAHTTHPSPSPPHFAGEINCWLSHSTGEGDTALKRSPSMQAMQAFLSGDR